MKNSIIKPILSSIAFFTIGFFIAKSYFNPPNSIVITPPTKLLSYTVPSADAHTMAVAFRKRTNLCPGSSTTPSSNDLKAGFFELSDTSVYDLVNAINIIKNRAGSSTPPKFFRVIYGIDSKSNQTKLIVAGLDKSNNEDTNSIQIIDGHVPCPVLCDINNSAVIMGFRRDPCN